MKKSRLLFLILGVMLILSGCFQSHRYIYVNKDGSGKIVEKMLISTEMGSGLTGNANYHDVEKLKSESGKFGEGVEYVSSKEIGKDNLKGYEVEYSFPDITKIKIAEEATENIMSMGAKEEEPEFITFQFKEGKEPELTIIVPEQKQEEMDEDADVEYEEEPEVSEEQQQQAMEMMRAMFGNMEISTKIIVEGKITRTNAMHKTDNEVILEEIIFADLPQDDKSIELMNNMNNMKQEEIEKLMKDYPGVKVENKDKITVSFK